MQACCAVCCREVVQLLMAHEASTNIVDVKGSSPLHLAAWTGNVDIVRLLLCRGPSVPNVNLTVSYVLLNKPERN
jgi:ankyrin repeat protein